MYKHCSPVAAKLGNEKKKNKYVDGCNGSSSSIANGNKATWIMLTE